MEEIQRVGHFKCYVSCCIISIHFGSAQRGLTIRSTGPIAAGRHLGYKSLAQLPARRNGPVSSNVRPRNQQSCAVTQKGRPVNPTPPPPTDDHQATIYKPYAADYKTLKRWRLAASICLYLTSAISIALPILEPHLRGSVALEGIRLVNFLGIIAYFILHLVADTFIYPATANARRMDFIDNSLNTKFLDKKSKNYFTNEEIPVGPHRMAVNCFENCFFTLNIAVAMLPQIIIKNTAFAIVFLTTAYFGFKDNSIGLPILNIFLSSLFITNLVHHLTFVARLKGLLQRFKLIFMEWKKIQESSLAHAILLILEYETILSHNKSPSSDRIYRMNSAAWAAEWNELKIRYEMVP